MFLIPGLNLDPGPICGTNCFAVGIGPKRYLIDACKKDHPIFINNLRRFCLEQNCYFDRVLITHAHYDHMDGAINVVQLMEELGFPVPKVHKYMHNNLSQQVRL